MNDFRIVPAGDAALVVEFEARIDPSVNARAIQLAEALQAAGVPGVLDVVPTFRSVAIYFDPLRTNGDALLAQVDAEAAKRWGRYAIMRDHLLDRYLLPRPRNAIADVVRHFASAGMDVSDGLAGEIQRFVRGRLSAYSYPRCCSPHPTARRHNPASRGGAPLWAGNSVSTAASTATRNAWRPRAVWEIPARLIRAIRRRRAHHGRRAARVVAGAELPPSS